MTRTIRSSSVALLLALVMGASAGSASAALLWADGFNGRILRAPWHEVDARWRVGSGALRVVKASVDRRTHVGYAVVGLGSAHRSGLRVSSKVRLSPGQSNIGVVAPFENAGNHLLCKVELTPGHPDGKVAIERRLRGSSPTLLRARGAVGLRKGAVYRVTVVRRLRVVTCSVQRNAAIVTKLRYSMTPQDLRAFGNGTKAGVRIRVVDHATIDDEDDGRSRFLDFRALAI